ncbi:MAG: tetratricopeptide repeat protein [Planctomycetes bacterium]|nr:tetratricopeptide repeat protein [Planctomycetota bacterium]
MKNLSRSHLLFALVALLAGGCATSSFGHRSENCDPDQRLEQLLDAYESGRNGGINSSGNLLADCQRARNAIERLALEFPAHAPTLLAAGQLAYENGEREKAQNYVDQIFRLQPIYPAAGVLRAQIATDEGNVPLARRVLETQIQYTPDHALLRESHAKVLFLSGDLSGAASAVDAAEALGAPAWRVAFHRGLIAEKAGRAAEARAQYQACIDANPSYAAAKSRLSGMNAQGG